MKNRDSNKSSSASSASSAAADDSNPFASMPDNAVAVPQKSRASFRPAGLVSGIPVAVYDMNREYRYDPGSPVKLTLSSSLNEIYPKNDATPLRFVVRTRVNASASASAMELIWGKSGDAGGDIYAHVELVNPKIRPQDNKNEMLNYDPEYDCLSAGEVYFNNQHEITVINNQSGGYRPDINCLKIALFAMQREGLKIANNFCIMEVDEQGKNVRRNDKIIQEYLLAANYQPHQNMNGVADKAVSYNEFYERCNKVIKKHKDHKFFRVEEDDSKQFRKLLTNLIATKQTPDVIKQAAIQFVLEKLSADGKFHCSKMVGYLLKNGIVDAGMVEMQPRTMFSQQQYRLHLEKEATPAYNNHTTTTLSKKS
jgi:hypothetical protein